eukprot:scaffold82702_cov59-Phaeocystis_antarctica.AAC.6
MSRLSTKSAPLPRRVSRAASATRWKRIGCSSRSSKVPSSPSSSRCAALGSIHFAAMSDAAAAAASPPPRRCPARPSPTPRSMRSTTRPSTEMHSSGRRMLRVAPSQASPKRVSICTGAYSRSTLHDSGLSPVTTAWNHSG